MVIKLLEIYKKELSSKKVFYKYLHWKKIVPYFVILFGLIVGSVSIAVWLDQPRLSLISYLSFPVLYVMRDILISERDRILRDGPLSIDWTHGIEKITQHNRTFVRIEWV